MAGEFPRDPNYRVASGAGLAEELAGVGKQCPVLWVCNGGCPKDRFATTRDGEPGLNYLCAGYYGFFTHAWPAMETVASLIRSGRPPSDIMQESK